MNAELNITGTTDAALEADAQKMLLAGITYIYSDDAAPSFEGFKGLTGMITTKNSEAKRTMRAAAAGLGDEAGEPTTALMQTVLSHIIFWNQRFRFYIDTKRLTKTEAWTQAHNDLIEEGEKKG